MDQSREQNENTSFAEALEASLDFKTPQQGDLLRGTVESIGDQDAYVTYGGPTEAVIALDELDGVEIGDVVEATVIQTSPELRISRRMILRQANIATLRAAFESGVAVEGKITGRNKGGYDVVVSEVRAFCPLSQIDLGRIADPDQWVGTTQEFRIIELSEDGKKFVVSRAALLKEEAAEKAAEVRETLAVGNVYEGTVRNVVPFGAFVDIGGIEGLLHVSEMSRRRISDPKEYVQVGDKVEVEVIRIEEGGKRISFSTKHAEPNPWSEVEDRYPVGAKFNGKIVRKADFGLFVEVEPGLDGLVHFSQLPIGMKQNDDSLEIGQSVEGWVREVDPDRQRLSLSLREVAEGDPWEDAQMKYPINRVVEGIVERASAPGIFVQLEPGLTGLVPVSELGLPPGSDPAKLVTPGEKIKVKVMSIDPERKRVSLSQEAAKHEASHQDYLRYQKEAKEGETKSAMALALEKALASGKR